MNAAVIINYLKKLKLWCLFQFQQLICRSINDVLFWNSYKITFSPGVDQWMACKAPICWVQWFLLHWIKNWGIRLGCGSRQLRDLPMDGKKLVIRWPIKKNNTSTGAKKKDQNILWRSYSSYSFKCLLVTSKIDCAKSVVYFDMNGMLIVVCRTAKF